MFEEAFEIYKKFGLKTKAIKVLLEQMEDLARAQEYATKVRGVDVAAVGSVVGQAGASGQSVRAARYPRC